MVTNGVGKRETPIAEVTLIGGKILVELEGGKQRKESLEVDITK